MKFTILLRFLSVGLLPYFLLTSASPLSSPSPDLSLSRSNATLGVAAIRPPGNPECSDTLSPPPYRKSSFTADCEAAIAKIPRDMRPASLVRNFYLLPEHKTDRMPNVLVNRLEWVEGNCVVHVLISARYMHIPHENATWMDIWGPARIIWQQCMAGDKLIRDRQGGIITRIGQNQKLDLVIYDYRSIFATARRLRDIPGAVDNVASTEFLQLLGIVPRPGRNELTVEGNAEGGSVIGEAGTVTTA